MVKGCGYKPPAHQRAMGWEYYWPDGSKYRSHEYVFIATEKCGERDSFVRVSTHDNEAPLIICPNCQVRLGYRW